MQSNTDFYRTRDLYFAAYLFAKKIEFLCLKKDKKDNFYWFVFSNQPKCEKEERDFMNNKSVVKAKDYMEAIMYLKRKVS